MSMNVLATVECGLDALEQELSAIRSEMIDAECHLHGRWGRLPDARRDSARNLLHYLALRRRDVPNGSWLRDTAGRGQARPA
jgi:hypothetical protein